MSDSTNDGGSAFPSRGGMMFYVPEHAQDSVADAVAKLDQYHAGMSLRDYFAAKAMQGTISGMAIALATLTKGGMDHMEDLLSDPEMCHKMYAVADAMLAARGVKS